METIENIKKESKSVLEPETKILTAVFCAVIHTFSDTNERIAHNAVMKLKSTDSKLKRDLYFCWKKYMDSFDQLCRDYELTED